MKRKAAKIALFSIAAVLLLLGCKDAFHDPGWDPNTATYEQDGVNRTVTFNANGGSGPVPSQQIARSGETIYLPDVGGLSRENYNFKGWNTNTTATGTHYPPGSIFTVPNQNVTLYAEWVAVSNGGGPGYPATPPPPTNITVTGSSTSSITISWSPVSGATGYYIYRGYDNSPTFTKAGTQSSTSFTDNGLSSNIVYLYRVSAYNSAGESAQSESVAAFTTLPAPTNVYAEATSSSSIWISWYPVYGIEEEIEYEIYRGLSPSTSPESCQDNMSSFSTFYNDTGLSPNTTYYYVIVAIDYFGSSVRFSKSSVVVSARTNP